MRRSLTISVVSGLLMLALARRVLRKRRHSCDTAARGIPGCTSDGPCLTPVFVQPAALSDGWSVAPALFYPPSTAVIPFVSPGEASCTPSSPSCTVEQATQDAVFILCEHLPFAAFLPSPNATNEEVVLSSIVKHSLLNAWLNESSVTIMSLDSVEALAELIPTDRALVYSHVALCPKALILIGHNGPFVIAAVVAVEHGPNDVAALLADSVKRGAITSILAATYAVPLQSQGDANDLSSQRLPDTPVGAQGGEFRLRCRHRSRMIVLRMPTGVCVESLPDHDRPTLFTVRVPLADGQQASFSFTSAMFNEVIELHNQSKQVCIRDVLEKHISSGDSPLPSEARVFWNRVVLADLRSFRDEETSGSSGGDAAETGVEVLYTHKHLGISFAVDITLGNSVLYDPLLTESASVLYYPLGVSPARNETSLAPLLSVQRLDRFPSTWSSVTKDDEELIHNVRFHFTNWGSVQTRCTFSDLSGQRCVHFTEECEGHRCRSYIILQNSTLLVIRLESSIAEWEQHWPTFQTIMDTLHLDKVK